MFRAREERMTRPDLGNKHECVSCHAKFYDLKKSEVVCPKCGTNQKEAKPTSSPSSGSRSSRRTTPAAPKVVPEEIEIEATESEAVEGDEIGDDDIDFSDDEEAEEEEEEEDE